MIRYLKRRIAAGALCAVCLPAVAAVDIGGAALDDSTMVAGRPLKLNGAGVGMRFLFKVYAIGLYLAERRSVAHEVLGNDDTRRLAIVMLRDVSSEDFASAVATDGEEVSERLDARVNEQMQRLASAISRLPRGLRKGDILTMDWIPKVGATVELNRRPLMEPVPDGRFYSALLGIWLGDKPTDPSLKVKLLGANP